MLSPSPSRSPIPRAHHHHNNNNNQQHSSSLPLPHLHPHSSNSRPPSTQSSYPPQPQLAGASGARTGSTTGGSSNTRQMYATASSTRSSSMQYSSLGGALGGSAAALAVSSRHPQSSSSFAPASGPPPIPAGGPPGAEPSSYSPVTAAAVSGDGRSYSAYPPSSYNYPHHHHHNPYQSSSTANAPASTSSPYEHHASSSSSSYVSHTNAAPASTTTTTSSTSHPSSLPPMRTASPISHTNLHVNHQHPQQQQQQQYSNPPYMSPYTQSHNPWASDEPNPPSSWAQQQQQQNYSSAPETASYAANRQTGDMTASPHIEQRPYTMGSASGSTPHQPQYSPRISYSSTHSPTSTSRGRGREYGMHGGDTAPPPPFRSPSSTATSLASGPYVPSLSDLSKMSRTYQQLYEDCLSISQPHQLQQPGSGERPVPLDRIEELVRAARKGFQYFHPHQQQQQQASSPIHNTHSGSSGSSSAAHQQIQHDRTMSVASEDARNGAGMESLSPELSAAALASARRQGEAPEGQSQKCLGCDATSTPEWRRGPLGPRTLCNACGLVYAKLMKKRGQGGNPANINNSKNNHAHPSGVGIEDSISAFGAMHSPTDGGGGSDDSSL